MILVMIILGILLIFFCILLAIWKKGCTKEIKGTFIGSNMYKGYSGYSVSEKYAPIFKYTYNDCIYEQQSFQVFSKRKIMKFEYGKQYIIYINEKNPKRFIVEKKFEFIDLIILIFGILFILVGLLMIGVDKYE